MKKKNNWLSFFFFFCLFDVIISTEFPWYVDRRIRLCLLAALKRFHLSAAPVSLSIFSVENEGSIDYLSTFPTDFLTGSLSDFLDLKSLHKVSLANENSNQFFKSSVARKLFNFNPYFVTEDHLVNSLLLSVLETDFKDSKNLKSETIHDELQLLILKYVNYDMSYFCENIPYNVYFYLILFLNEFLYGVDSFVSIDDFVIVDFLLRFRSNAPAYVESFKYLAVQINGINENNNYFMNQWILVSTNPTKQDVMNFFNLTDEDITPDLFDSDVLQPKEFRLFFADILISDLSEERFFNIIYGSFFSEQKYPRDSYQLYHVMANRNYSKGSDNIKEIRHNFIFFWHRATVCKAYKEGLDDENQIYCHFHTRNTLNELDFKKYHNYFRSTEFNPETLSFVKNLFSFNLYQIQAFSDMIRYDSLNIRRFKGNRSLKLKISLSCLYDLLRKEFNLDISRYFRVVHCYRRGYYIIGYEDYTMMQTFQYHFQRVNMMVRRLII